MKKQFTQKLLATIITFLIIISMITTVFAETIPDLDPSIGSGSSSTVPTYLVDDTKTGSLTINKKEQSGDSTESSPLAGVTFTIYKVADTVETTTDAETYITDNSVTGTSLTTGDTGTVVFEDLELGRYYVKETAYPGHVVTPMTPFLVDIPMTNEDGTEWVYDVVADPKNQTAYGDVNLVKTDADTGLALEGVTFKVQKEENSAWSDYAVDGSAEFTTDADGKITLTNLPAGKYRFVETATLEGYILDETKTYEFEVLQDQTEAIIVNATNEKVELTKEVKSSTGDYVDSTGVFATDTVEWKISVDVPTVIGDLTTFEVVDTASSNIEIDTTAITIKGISGQTETTLTSGTEYTMATGTNQLTWTFDTSKLIDTDGNALYEEITIEYQGTLKDLTNVYGTDLQNSASVTYTSVINEDNSSTATAANSDTASVHTGKLLVYKTDGTNALSGAIFKIATSEENAKNGTYVKGADGNDLTATSDSNGYVIFEGLKYGADDETASEGETSYWLVEVQAPTDYNLLKSPVEVKVNSTSGTYSEDTTTEIVNKKGFELPETGAIGAILLPIAGVALIIFVIVMFKKEDKKESK